MVTRPGGGGRYAGSMSRSVSFTLDLEDLRTTDRQEYRVRHALDQVLMWLNGLGVKGTVFAVGELAERDPGLITDVVGDGHELGLHGWKHVPLTKLEPDELQIHLRDGRKLLQDLSGQSIDGFRAPILSLTPESSFAVELIGEAGFTYSSSILPTDSPLFGYPGLPLGPFRWTSGLVELPCPTVPVLRWRVPYLGGAYLRVLPSTLWKRGLARADASEPLWTYSHPWEFDTDERFHRHPDVGWLTSLAGFVGRKGIRRKLERVMAGGVGPALGELVADIPWVDSLPVVPMPEAVVGVT